jgi:CheY-like chemotaxis protein
LTANAFKEDRDRAFANGFTEYLTKPINRSALIRTLDERLSAMNLH